MAQSEERFEVLIEREGHWTIRFQTASETEAQRQAQALFTEEKVEAVKIVAENIAAGSGRALTRTIMERRREIVTGPAGLSGHIDEADLCTTVPDLLKWSSRRILNKLFRDHLDTHMVTPTGILHNYDHMTQLEEDGGLILLSIGTVAVTQVEKNGGAITDRRSALEVLRQDLKNQIDAIGADGTWIINIEAGGLPTYAENLKSHPTLDARLRDSYLATSIARSIKASSGWIGKLERLLALLPEDTLLTGEVVRAVDRLMSDILSGSQAIKEILGEQATLGDAILTMTHLHGGNLAYKRYMPAIIQEMNNLMADYPMISSQAVLGQWIAKEIQSHKNLTKDDPDKEVHMLARIIDAQSEDLRLTPEMQEAFAHRSREQLPAEIQRIFGIVRDPLACIDRLLSIQDCAIGAESLALLMSHITNIITTNPEGVQKFLEASGPAMEQLRHLYSIHQQIKQMDTFESEKDVGLDALDTMCLDLARKHQVIQKIEAQAPDLPSKVNKLLVLATSNVLPQGKSMDALRARITNHTMTPGFIKEYTDQARTPEEATKLMAEFKKMLQNAGLV